MEIDKDKLIAEAQVVKVALLPYWREVIIMILIAFIMFVFWLYNEKQQELQNEIAKRTADEITRRIEAGNIVVNKHEKEDYPKIDKQIKQINKDVKSINYMVQQLEKNKPTKDKSYEIFKNQSASQINKFFTNNGYANTIVSDGK